MLLVAARLVRLPLGEFQALIVLKITILSWEYEWVYFALEEFVTMLVLAHLGTTFAPLDPWLLTRAFDHSLEQN